MDRKTIGYALLIAGVASALAMPDLGIVAAGLMVVGLLLAFS